VTEDDFNTYCRALPATTHVVQWGGAHVWKVGGKVFAICGWADDDVGITFKVSDLSFEILRDQPGLRPAPYLAARGMTWIQHYRRPGLDDGALRDYMRESHRIVAAGLTKRKQRDLGLLRDDGPGKA